MVGIAIFNLSGLLLGFTIGSWIFGLFRSSFESRRKYNTQMAISIAFFLSTTYLSLYLC